MRRNRYLGASSQKSYPCHSLRRPRFPTRRGYFHYQMTFAAYILCFCAQFLIDLVTLTFDLMIVAVSDELSFIHLTHVPIFLESYDYPFLTYAWLNLITWNGHCACAVARDLSPAGQKWSTFWNPWTQFVYSLCHFQGATTKIKTCYRRKIAFFPLWRLHSSLRMRSIKWPVHRVSQNHT